VVDYLGESEASYCIIVHKQSLYMTEQPRLKFSIKVTA